MSDRIFRPATVALFAVGRYCRRIFCSRRAMDVNRNGNERRTRRRHHCRHWQCRAGHCRLVCRLFAQGCRTVGAGFRFFFGRRNDGDVGPGRGDKLHLPIQTISEAFLPRLHNISRRRVLALCHFLAPSRFYKFEYSP